MPNISLYLTDDDDRLLRELIVLLKQDPKYHGVRVTRSLVIRLGLFPLKRVQTVGTWRLT